MMWRNTNSKFSNTASKETIKLEKTALRTDTAWSVGNVITDDYSLLDPHDKGAGGTNATRVYVLSNTELRENPNYVKWYILIGSGFVMLFVPIAVMFFSCVSIRLIGVL